MADRGDGPLAGLRVVDAAQLIAGPLCATLLADLGADVVKVERPGAGDALRQLAPHKEGVSLWWKVNGRNKRCIALDLKDAADRETFAGLTDAADVVVENSLPGAMGRLGLGYEQLSARNPALIMLSVTGYGQDGPNRDRRAFGRTAEGFSGMAYLTGYPDRPPTNCGIPVADCVSAVCGAFAVMSAVYERAGNPDGRGQHIDLALYEAVFRLMEFVPIAYDQLHQVTERLGDGNSYVAPVGTWKSADGTWISFTGSTQAMVQRLFVAIGRDDLLTDPRFAENTARVANRDELHSIIAEWIGTHDADEIVAVLDRHQVAISPILSIADIFEDPHFAARDAIVTVPDNDLGPLRMQGVVPRFSRTPGRVRYAGRAIDADREEILRSWLAPATRP
jgi:succinyl-CoA---D-citramalate CoA-transferase